MNRYKLEKGIPIPRREHPRDVGITETLRNIEVGDSFLVKSPTERQALFARSYQLKIKLVSRTVEGGYRVWRVG